MAQTDDKIGEMSGLAPNGMPIINTRTVSTTVRLLDGQPFVIAGMRRQQNLDSTAKAPLLGSIPILGYLAGGEQDVERRTDVIVTITPRFILASQHRLEMAPRVEVLRQTVHEEAALPVPPVDWGFDQWLLGS